MKFKGIRRQEASKNWDDAFPVGNGTIGGLVFGDPYNEKIVTNHEELYLPTPENNDSRPFQGAEFLEETRRLIREGKEAEAVDYYFAGLGKDGFPVGTTIWTNPFETVNDIHIDMNISGLVCDYSHKLDFATGEDTVEYIAEKTHFERKTFVSRGRNILVTRIRNKENEAFSLSFYFDAPEETQYMASINNYIKDDFLISEGFHSEMESGYVCAARIVTDGDVIRSDSKRSFNVPGESEGMDIVNAHEVLILYSIVPFMDRPEAEKVKLLRELSSTMADYDMLFKEHALIHRELFERVRVSFSEVEKEYFNEEIIGLCREDMLAPEFLERMVDFGRYLEISSFGKLPPNLQGVWNGKVNPPWSSDYTLDENIQMMMWMCLPGDLSECVRSYFDWLESYKEDFKQNAMAYYGCNGILCAARASTDGFHRHFNEGWPLIFWTAGAGWLSRLYQEYYEYTGDRNILLRGVKYWMDVVLFYEDFMVPGDDGKYEFIPSYSPENTPLGNKSSVAINSTMDVAVAKEVYSNLINACKELGIEEENVAKWEREYELLPEYKVNEDGAIKEWLPDRYKDDYHHRHSSHLYMVFPGHEALEPGNEELFSACHEAAKCRLIDGVDAISGWGLAHLANISARLKDAELWYLAMNRLIQKFTLPNFFTTHNEHRLFQMDANLGLTAATYEMFAYSDGSKVELFPVLPKQFADMKIYGLKVKGQVEIKELTREGEHIHVICENSGREPVRIVCPKQYSFENGNREEEVNPGETLNLHAFYRN